MKLRNMSSIYIHHKDKMLLLYRIGSKIVPPSWCGVGGHFEKNELNDAEACVIRELKEETGIAESDLVNLKLRYITLRLKNQEIRQNYYFFAELAREYPNKYTCDEGILEWVDIDEILNRNMPHTAKFCLEHYLSTGRYNNNLYAGSAARDGINFEILSEF